MQVFCIFLLPESRQTWVEYGQSITHRPTILRIAPRKFDGTGGLNRFIQTEKDYGEIFLLTRHMSQFCQPIFLEVNPVGSYRGREVYFKDPYSFVMCGFDFHRDPDSSVQIPMFYRSLMEFFSRTL